MIGILEDTPVGSLRNGIQSRFSENFEKRGFGFHQPLPIVSPRETSTRFVGSTISVFKQYILENKFPDIGFHTIQSCLRTRNQKTLADLTSAPEWASYFRSVGAFANFSQLDRLVESTVGWFQGMPHLDSRRIVLQGTAKCPDILESWRSATDWPILNDTYPPEYYIHRFGMEGVSGRNCNIAILDAEGKFARDVGNIIVIERAGRPIALEVAFGVETLTSRILNMASAIHAALISEIIKPNSVSALRAADSISAGIAILHAGERPFGNNRGRILRAYLLGAYIAGRATGLELQNIMSVAKLYEHAEFGSNMGSAAYFSEYISSYEALFDAGVPQPDINDRLSRLMA